MFIKCSRLLIFLFLFCFLFSCSNGNDKNNNHNSVYDPPEYNDLRSISATGSNGMIAATSGKQSIKAALEIMKEGGNACDAVLTCAMDEIVRAAGCWVSFAGMMSLVYYKAETGEIFTITGTYKTPYNETDPLSIPTDQPTGRSALVPGFFAAVDEAHKKLGGAPWERILAPAIKTAEEGFVLSEMLENRFIKKLDVITRTPEGKAIFVKPDGTLYSKNDIFKQPLLAKTLRKFAAERSDYIYKGEWARGFVQIVQREGGKITMKDMEDYKPVWTNPAHTNYYGYDIYAVNYPCTAGVSIISMLNIMQTAGLNNISGYTTVPASFINFAMIARIGSKYTIDAAFPDFMKKHFPDMDFSSDFMLSQEVSQFFWDIIKTGVWNNLEKEYYGTGGGQSNSSAHSDAVVAIDSMGNAAAMTHTINTVNWGSTGIFVDGVSIPDSGADRNAEMKYRGPGEYMSEGMASVVIIKDGKAFLASASPGNCLREHTLQHIFNIINDGLQPARSIARRAFQNNAGIFQRIPPGDFSDSFIAEVEKMGQHLSLDGGNEQMWVGILLDSVRGLFGGASTYLYDAGIAAY